MERSETRPVPGGFAGGQHRRVRVLELAPLLALTELPSDMQCDVRGLRGARVRLMERLGRRAGVLFCLGRYGRDDLKGIGVLHAGELLDGEQRCNRSNSVVTFLSI